MNTNQYDGLKIPDDCVAVRDEEKASLIADISKQISTTKVPDDVYPGRVVRTASPGYENRILLEPVALDGIKKLSWTEDIVDKFYSKYINSHVVFWSREIEGHEFDPVCIGPYSRDNRRWLREYSILHGLITVGFTSDSGNISLVSDTDCDFTILVGKPDILGDFDLMCGGKDLLCGELLQGLKENDIRYGADNPYAFMSTYFPILAGCK